MMDEVEALRIHFLSEVFLAVALVVASTPKFLCPSAYSAVHLTLAHGGNQPTRVSTHRRAFAGGVPRIRVVSIYLTVYPH